jgi:type I restriction enzyme S subunit
MQNQYPRVQLADLLDRVERRELVVAEKQYPLLGVRWYGNGLFLRETKGGRDIRAKYVYKVRAGDFVYSRLFAWKGSFAVATDEFDGCYVSNEFPCFRVDAQRLDIDYLLWYFRQESMWTASLWKSTGSTAISRNRLRVEEFLAFHLPLPSLETQRYIRQKVARVHRRVSLMSATRKDLLVDVAELRQGIFQLAIQGKLVPQNSDDEPAGILLDNIRQRQAILSPVTPGDVPYELPEGWEWVRLGAIGQINPRNIADDSLEVSFVPMALIPQRYGERHGQEIRKWGDVRKGFTHFSDGDVVVAKITPCFQNGKSAVLRGLQNGIGAGTTELHVFRAPQEWILPDYVLLYFKSPSFLEEGVQKMTGTAGQQRVPREYVFSNPFPLPPREEQKRIVEKVDRLMALCDRLEANITQAQQDSELLMQAVLQEAFA